MYTVEIYTSKGWEIAWEGSCYSDAMSEWQTYHALDPFGVRMTCQPVSQ